MTDVQLYLAVGMPTLAVLLGIFINSMQFNAQIGALSARLSSLESHVVSMENRMENRMTSLESKFDVRFDMLLSKVVDIDNRLTRLEERMSH